jgi:hypothetical protein
MRRTTRREKKAQAATPSAGAGAGAAPVGKAAKKQARAEAISGVKSLSKSDQLHEKLFDEPGSPPRLKSVSKCPLLAEEAEEVEAPAKPHATRFADILFAEADDEEGADEVLLVVTGVQLGSFGFLSARTLSMRAMTRTTRRASKGTMTKRSLGCVLG